MSLARCGIATEIDRGAFAVVTSAEWPIMEQDFADDTNLRALRDQPAPVG